MTPEEQWQEFLSGCRHNLFMNSNLGRSAFAAGAAAVIVRLQGDCSKRELKKILGEFREFTAAYMRETT